MGVSPLWQQQRTMARLPSQLKSFLIAYLATLQPLHPQICLGSCSTSHTLVDVDFEYAKKGPSHALISSGKKDIAGWLVWPSRLTYCYCRPFSSDCVYDFPKKHAKAAVEAADGRIAGWACQAAGVPGGVRLQRGEDVVVQRDHAARARFRLRFADGQRLLVYQVDLAPPEFAESYREDHN